MTAYRVIEACEGLSVNQAAKLLGVQPGCVRTWIKTGTIETARVFGSMTERIPRSEVIRLLREQVDLARQERKLVRRA